jgi:hypothetical protein
MLSNETKYYLITLDMHFSPRKRDDYIKLKRVRYQTLRGKGLLNMFVLLNYLSQEIYLQLIYENHT